MENKIRVLKANEIECRVQQVTDKGCILLIYKDARVDMRLLDEIYGIDGWQRTHETINGNLFCTVEIWSEEKKQWIKKQDVGIESNTEKQKGEASDSFKRACFNIGIGRELYSAPFTWINLEENEISKKGDKCYLKSGVKFFVKEIEYNEDRDISKLIIVDSKGKIRFPTQNNKQTPDSTNNAKDFLNNAIKEVNEATTEEILLPLWTKYKDLTTITEFKTAFNNKRAAFYSISKKLIECAGSLENLNKIVDTLPDAHKKYFEKTIEELKTKLK